MTLWAADAGLARGRRSERWRRRVHCGAAAGCGLRRAAAAASEPLREAGAAPPPVRSPMRVRPPAIRRARGRWLGWRVPETQGIGAVRRGREAEKGCPGTGKCLEGAAEDSPRESQGRASGEGGRRAGWQLECCISWGGAKLRSGPFPPPRSRRGGARSRSIHAVPGPTLATPDLGQAVRSSFSGRGPRQAPTRLTGRLEVSGDAGVLRASICAPGTRHSHWRLMPAAPESSGGKPGPLSGCPRARLVHHQGLLHPSRDAEPQRMRFDWPLGSSHSSRARRKVGFSLAFRFFFFFFRVSGKK